MTIGIPMKKLAIVSSHPIQYNAPLLRLLAGRGRISIRVFYTWGKSVLEKKYDPGFGRIIEWDIPLLEGYEYEFLENSAADKGTHHFKGIDNPDGIKVIREYAPDAILIYGWAFKSHLSLMKHFHGKIPVLFRGDSTLLDDKPGGIRAMVRRIFLSRIYSRVDFALYVGTNNLKYFRRAGLTERKLVYAPHAVDNNRFRRNHDNEGRALTLRQELNIPPSAPVFLFAGKLEAKKDPLLLLRAFTDTGLTNHAHLLFVGNGELEPELKNKAKDLESVHFMDFQNQSIMPAIYCLGDVFVLPSRGPGETWGLAINESMAAGCVVIASDKCGGAVDLISPGENGFLFSAGDGGDLGRKLLAVFNARERIALMKQESLKRIEAFSFEKVALAIEEVMDSLPANGHK